ncbi:MAG: xanthine dehydrogenase family protein molybdopterin-binding subunit [Oscillospiraceae bacterium]|nr:xanthine dehydrogenase family protein molybdopterin-binding subunit [Oscillospiraceae bacterium]
MNPISNSVTKRDHSIKINGSAVYVCDYPTEGMLFGRILRSGIAKGTVKNVKLPELPQGYYYVDKTDVPGFNEVHMIQDDTPVFTDNPQFIGDPVGMLVGVDELLVNEFLLKIEVEYDEETPVFDARLSEDVFFAYDIDKGDTDSAFANADRIIEYSYETGLQEHIYLETNGMIAQYKDGKMNVHGSMQCPYYLHRAVVHATGLRHEDISIRQDVTGGGFGGKEDFPSTLACQVAVAALKANGKPVRVVFEREEDITATSKRHPSYCTYKAAIKGGRITGMIVDVLLDAGAYTTMSMVVLQRATNGACGVYDIPNIKIHGHARKTNTIPNGAFRGFGGPQVFFAIEMLMTHIAKELDTEPVKFKKSYFVNQGDSTSTDGVYHFPVPLPVMLDDVLSDSGYYEKLELFKNQNGRFRRGIGVSAVFHGAGFTGNGERDVIKATVRLSKSADGKVEILTGNTDMGQGLLTTLVKIVAKELDIPPDDVILTLPDTRRVPDSGPTVASRSVMIVGELLRRACLSLKNEWIDGEEQTVEQHYRHPDFLIPFDAEVFKGDAYPTYSWAVNAVEVEIDTLTGYISIPGAWGSFDVGTPIDENIVIGQMEGGFLQSLGWGIMENCAPRNGKIGNKLLCDYIVPTSLDVTDMNVRLYVEEYPEGPFGAKGAGEMPHVGGAPAIIEAVQNALGINIYRLPFMAEDVMDVLRSQKAAEKEVR